MGDAAEDAERRAEWEREDEGVIPLWETGDDGLLVVLGITTPCCDSCQWDFHDEMPDAGESFEVRVGDGWEQILTCCAHRDEIEQKLQAKGVVTR